MEKAKKIKALDVLADVSHISNTRRGIGDTTLLIEGIKATKDYHEERGNKFIILCRTHTLGMDLAHQAGLFRNNFITVVPEEPFKYGARGVYVIDPGCLSDIADLILKGID